MNQTPKEIDIPVSLLARQLAGCVCSQYRSPFPVAPCEPVPSAISVAYEAASAPSFSTVFQFLAVPRMPPSFFSTIVPVSFERPMPSG